jgi:hypothetical protein
MLRDDVCERLGVAGQAAKQRHPVLALLAVSEFEADSTAVAESAAVSE